MQNTERRTAKKQKRENHDPDEQLSCQDIDLSAVCEDIKFQICLELPADALFQRFRHVGDGFNLVCDPIFINQHLNHHRLAKNPSILLSTTKRVNPNDRRDVLLQFDVKSGKSGEDSLLYTRKIVAPVKSMDYGIFDDGFAGIGSCDGLVCFKPHKNKSNGPIWIWNPSTMEYITLSDGHIGGGDTIRGDYGFGYDRLTDDYKIIANVYHRSVNTRIYTLIATEVFSLRMRSWRSIKENHRRYCYCNFSGGDGWSSNMIFSNGSFYWLVNESESRRTVIISFDISKEEYVQVSIPEDPKLFNIFRLRLLEGCMFMLGTTTSGWKTWVMKEDRGGWTELIGMADELIGKGGGIVEFKPMRYWRRNEILVATQTRILSYDPRKNKAQEVKRFAQKICDAVAYSGSLVSLNGGGAQ